MKPLIALQLYTLRDLLKDDILGTLEKVAALGYQGVEMAGYGAASKAQVAAKLRELNLKVVGAHVGIEALQEDFEGVIAENRALDNSYFAVPYLAAERRGSREKWLETSALLNDLGAQVRAAGLRFGYHNHAFELEEQFDGERGLDILLGNAASENLAAEIDTYWVQKGGGSPVEYLERYAGRIPVVHIKDMTPAGGFAEIGAGILPWPAIFEAAEAGGVTAYVVEQDTCPGNPLDSIAISIQNLQKMGKV